jgi:hypothetical protein
VVGDGNPFELPEGLDQLRDRGEGSDPKQVLFECADESLGDANALRFPNGTR